MKEKNKLRSLPAVKNDEFIDEQLVDFISNEVKKEITEFKKEYGDKFSVNKIVMISIRDNEDGLFYSTHMKNLSSLESLGIMQLASKAIMGE